MFPSVNATSLQRLLDTHDPYPGVVLDRQWNVVLANRGGDATGTRGLVPRRDRRRMFLR